MPYSVASQAAVVAALGVRVVNGRFVLWNSRGGEKLVRLLKRVFGARSVRARVYPNWVKGRLYRRWKITVAVSPKVAELAERSRYWVTRASKVLVAHVLSLHRPKRPTIPYDDLAYSIAKIAVGRGWRIPRSLYQVYVERRRAWGYMTMVWSEAYRLAEEYGGEPSDYLEDAARNVKQTLWDLSREARRAPPWRRSVFTLWR